MEKSQSIKNLGAALTTFQTKMEKIKKDSTNPFYKNKYASLSTILENIQLPLSEAGISFSQLPDGECLTTILIHNDSGEYLQSCYNIHATRPDPQGIGSAITYARRYALCSILGLNVDEDDDGNEASKPQANGQQAHTPGKIEPKQVNEIEKPWLNEKQFNDCMYRINNGEMDVYEKAKASFRIKKDYREALEGAVNFSKSLA